MSILFNLTNIYENCREEFEAARPGRKFSDVIRFKDGENTLALCDNLDILKAMISQGKAGTVDFIYIDPPFFSGADYCARVSVAGEGIKSKAYGDRWDEGLEGFLSMLCIRLMYMKELLADKGVIAVHLDRHAVHYVKILMDEIFGQDHFVNELIWTYKSGGASKHSFAHKHDTILVYSRTDAHVFHPQQEVSYNRQGRPYNFKGVTEYMDDDGRWYTLVNRKDVIAVDMVGRTSAERTGYATQKPEALLRILIESFTDPGALCADFFCGSGTLASAANHLGRKFICCDKGAQAVENSMKRLYKDDASFTLAIAGGCRFRTAKASAELENGKVTITSYSRRLDSLKLTPAQKEKLQKSKRGDKLSLLDFFICGEEDADGVLQVSDTNVPQKTAVAMAFDAFGGAAKINFKK